MSLPEQDRSIWAVRGAITVDKDDMEEIRVRTAELLREILVRNDIHGKEIVSIIFTATPDLVSDFPAVAARDIGLSDVPLLCTQEIPVQGSISRCIRVLLHFNTNLERNAIRHVYLRKARQLRLDLHE